MTNTAITGQSPAPRAAGQRRSRAVRRTLAALEFVTGAAGVVGGVLLAAAPDGSLLRADPGALAGTPFGDWRVPGVLLAVLVGGGFLVAGWWQWRNYRYARELSLLACARLIRFRVDAQPQAGCQPLEGPFDYVRL